MTPYEDTITFKEAISLGPLEMAMIDSHLYVRVDGYARRVVDKGPRDQQPARKFVPAAAKGA